MASDRARISFDPTRAYRSVIAQQGRVTLEADVNEEAMIAGEALRLETIDIVGPAGTPDDGYAVSLPGGLASLTIGAGTMYLGGWRLTLANPVKIDAQPDWLDRPNFSLGTTDVVSLLITEQSVCAVEDQALREIALGGPDSAARYRLTQHFLLIGMDGDTCAEGLTAVEAALAADGCSLDVESDQILSSATLQVGFVPPTTPPDPCSPAAAGGYLGADNQLVRVTVTAFDAGKNAGTLLWGWNNASFLYRATLTDPVQGIFTLTGAPVDEEHAPQLGQAVEILRTRVDLGDGIPSRNLIAADAGFVTTVAQAYSFDTGQLTIADAADLPPEYAADTTPLFVRLWQAVVPFEGGVATALDTTSGLTVTLSLTALPSRIAARPFWRFAVRPNEPAQVYPERYMDSPQPPDGPRQWICDLAVVQGEALGAAGDQQDGAVLADCRATFDPLIDRKPCCGLTLDPKGVDALGGLQAVVDSLAGGPAVLSLKPGDYILRAPLLLTGLHRRLTLEGCTYGASIRPDPANLTAFGFGLIVVEKADAVTLRRLELDVPAVLSGQTGARLAAGAAAGQGGGGTVCGVLVADSGLITIEDCAFGIKAPDDGRVGGLVFGGAIAVVGRAVDLTVRRNLFVGKAIFVGGEVCGLIATVNTDVVHTALIEVEVSDNYFERLNLAVFAYARLGVVRCFSNRVKNCEIGFLFAETQLGAAGEFAKQAVDGAAQNQVLGAAVQTLFPAQLLAQTVQSKAAFFARAAPPEQAQTSATARNVLVKDMVARGGAAYAEIAGQAADRASSQAAAAPAPSPPQAAAKDQTAAKAQAAASQAQMEYVGALSHVQQVSVQAELTAFSLTTALHIRDNDVTLAKPSQGPLPGVGVLVINSPRDDVAMVMMSGNRVLCPDITVTGAVLFFANFATVTGNMLVRQAAADDSHPVFISLGFEAGDYVYSGNLFHSYARITPVRTSPAPSPDWSLLNTFV